MQLKFNDLVQRAHSLAVEKGWWDNGDRPYREIMMLIVSEIAEATEEVRNGTPAIYQTAHHQIEGPYKVEFGSGHWSHCLKPEGEAIELADVCIRIFDWFGRNKLDLDYGIGQFAVGVPSKLSPLEQHFEIVRLVSVGTDIDLAEAVLLATSRIKELGVDPEIAIELKMAFNATRPRRHGGKLF